LYLRSKRKKKMPYSSAYSAPFSSHQVPFWSSEDWRNVALASLIPGSAAVVAYAVLRDDDSINWWMRAKKPDWAPTDRCMYGLMDTVAIAPLGYASYLIYKYGGTEDTTSRIALGLYGFNVLMMITNMPLLKQRDHGTMFIHSTVNHLASVATAIAFYKINNEAGMWMIPHVIVSGFHALLSFAMNNLNSQGSIRKNP